MEANLNQMKERVKKARILRCLRRSLVRRSCYYASALSPRRLVCGLFSRAPHLCVARHFLFSILILFVFQSFQASADLNLIPDKSLEKKPDQVDLQLHTLTDEQKARIEKIGEKPLLDQINEIKKEVPLELIATDRKGGTHYFDILGPATRKLDQITDIEGLYGKAVCPKNSKSQNSKSRLLIADDAPPTTLLHEYIHFLQMSNDKRWCELDGRLLEGDEKKERAVLYHRFEFEDLKELWDLRDKFAMNFEDKLILIEGLNRENLVFKDLGVKALSDDESAQITKGLDDLHAQIQVLTWLTRKPDDAGGVLNKMEVISLKSCVEQSSGSDELKKINDCIHERCSLAKIKCDELTKGDLKNAGDDLTSKVTFAWLKPLQKGDCSLAKLKDELTDYVEAPTLCWKTWYANHRHVEKDLKLRYLKTAEALKSVKAPPMAIDSKISFYEPPNPQGFINAAYCYFIFEKIAKFETLPVNQFAYATLGASLSLKNRGRYNSWLAKTNEGKSCATLVKVFTGEEPSDLEDLGEDKKNLLIINPVAALTGGLENYKGSLKIDMNHERLHIVFSEDKNVQRKVKLEWAKLSGDEKDKFKNAHPSYDFTNEDVLLKEYFAYSRQGHPQKLF